MFAISIVLIFVFAVLLAIAFIKRAVIESLLHYIAGYFIGGDIQSSIALDSPIDEETIRTVDGDLVSYLRIRGASRLIGKEEFEAKAEKLADVMRTMLSDGTGRQHGVSIGYLSDPPGTRNVIRDLLRGAVTTAQRMGASKNAKLWFDEREKFLGALCNDETVIMAVYTFKSGLNHKEGERYHQWVTEANQSVTKISKEYRAKRGANGRFSQPIVPVFPLLLSRHKAVIDNFQAAVENEAAGIAIIVDKLQGDEALYYLRRFIDGTNVAPSWRPRLIGSKAMTGAQIEREGDMAHVAPLAIARQLITEPTRDIFENIEAVQREGVWYGSLKMDVCPHEDPAPGFAELVDRMGVKFPYAISIEISPNGLEFRKVDQTFAGFFGGFGNYNRAIRDAWNALRDIQESGEYVAAMRLVCTTWGKSEVEVSDQVATLKMALQSWGGSTVSNESGSPSDMLLATAPTLSRYNPAPFLSAPLATISRLLPVFRAASPWDTGQLILRSKQGKPYPVAFGATNQAFWGTLVFAPPGRGKSFLMNCLNAGLLFSPGLTDLPYITIIDKGMSSANVIETARGILPADRKHQALSIRLRNTEDYAINPLDTQLGLDMPTERERDFQVNIISSLCPNLGPEGGRFIGQVVDAAYRSLSRQSMDAKRWQRALDPAITAKVEAIGMKVDDNNAPRIWDVVDALFDMGDTHAAISAQRFAVPILDDLIKASHQESVQDLYSRTPTPTNEIITEVFARSITTASREYALLSTHTRFDIGDARVISIDLEEVLASASSEEARRRAAVMILFARQIGAKNYFLKWSEMEKLVPERYRGYQSTRIKVLSETLKFLEYDEFHNASGMTDVLRMVETDFREGRKYNVVPLLSSQLFQDFSKDLIETSNNFFVLGVGSAEASKKIQDTFELSDAERRAILNDCVGPGPKGAPLFAMFKTDRGTVSQLLYNSASTMEQWAFNSSALDVAVRQAVQEGLKGDYWLALKGLSRVFPRGTARHEIERVRQQMAGDESADEGGVTATVARKAVEKIMQLDLLDD